ncbi:hypothetical protein RS130_17870 [Paraglaciecola aquimarina]|uniref:Uncharacterized protein n=1 Tax=Paraglaciecola aquimarina TaxID=1235557 RepID=A0ABU3SZS8_9ALTE|nr:hypothetical protein [Paraglaciecola aquimarina]MDU0355515.1 hypothetical protein [Paraglaciecola aquimarina]
MLKAYAVAMVLASSNPVAVKAEKSVQAPVKSQASATKSVVTTKSGVRAGTVRF